MVAGALGLRCRNGAVFRSTVELTAVEKRVGRMIATGRTHNQCAAALGVHLGTVRKTWLRVLGKLGLGPLPRRLLVATDGGWPVHES